MMIRPPIFVLDKHNANATHYLSHIVIRREAPYPVAVLAQEIVEWQYAIKKGAPWGAVPTIGSVLAFPDQHWGAYVAIGVLSTLFASLMPRRIEKTSQQMELLGHMVEVIVAEKIYGANPVEHILREAQAMQRWYSQFKGWEIDQLMEGMEAVEEEAERWVDANLDSLKKLLPRFKK